MVKVVQQSTENGPAAASFEDALRRLEEIVESMEEGEISLDDLLERYEEGNKLLKICSRRLREAELKIELLRKNGENETIVPLENDPA